MNDELLLVPDTEDEPSTKGFWKVLIVDDEHDVHEITKLALDSLIYKDKGIEFLCAFSKKEAIQIVDLHPDIAVVFLDVVMEKDSSGLELVDYIRKEKELNDLRIILRTGQPGVAPERTVIDIYDIDGYATKSELTTNKLYSILRSALKNYHDILAAKETQSKLILASTTAELREILTSMIIHDLRNPLSIIQSILTIWKTKPVFIDNAQMKGQFDLVSKASNTISEMIIEQLKLSQLESGKYVPEIDVVDVNELIHLVYCGFAQNFNDHLQYEYHVFPRNFPKLLLDRELLRRIITNLLSNAIRYTSEGTVAVRCQYQKQQELLVVSVTDTGNGIKKEEVPRLFDRFYQAGNAMKKKTTFGIGLSFCDFAVKAMGGEITVESEMGEGSEFRISIPAKMGKGNCLILEDAEKKTEQSPINKKEKAPVSLDDLKEQNGDNGVKVLLVDDSKTIRRIMKLFLAKLGINNIDEARNGHLAIERLSEKEYDVVFLDITMPVMTGLEVLDIIKPRFPQLPVVMLTAEHLMEEEAKKLNVSAFITKPFPFEIIEETVRELNLI